jgi:hypothetical protein
MAASPEKLGHRFERDVVVTLVGTTQEDIGAQVAAAVPGEMAKGGVHHPAMQRGLTIAEENESGRWAALSTSSRYASWA